MSDISRVEQLLRNALGEDIYEVTPQSRVEELLQQLNELIDGMGGSVDPTVIEQIVTDWLDAHPEATTTVQDGAITLAKLHPGVRADVEEIDELKEEIVDKSDMLIKAFPTDAALGAVASFADGANVPVKSLVVNIDPVQDLHGQDAPYPAGGGKNLLPLIDGIYNIGSTGATANVSNGAITVTGTSTTGGGRTTRLSDYFVLKAGTYIISPVVSSPYVRGYINKRNDDTAIGYSSGNTITIEQDTEVYYGIGLESGVTYNITIKPQIEEGGTITPYAPYSNICPISGHTQAVVTRTGVNVWDEEWEVGALNTDTGKDFGDGGCIRSKNFIPMFPNTEYYIHGTGVRFVFYDAGKNYIESPLSLSNRVYTTSANVRYGRFYKRLSPTTYNHDISVNYPSTDHDYHPYSGQSINIQLGQTVYGGTLDVVTGELVVDRATITPKSVLSVGTSTYVYCIVNISNSPSFPNNDGGLISNMFYVGYPTLYPGRCYLTNAGQYAVFCPIDQTINTKELADAWLAENDVQLCYKLATPLTITLTPHEVTALLGSNNVWADTGDSTVEYRADPTLYIQRLTESDADMIADANITSGQYFMVGNTLYKATANIASGATISPNVNCTRKSLSEALNEINA